MVDQTQRIRFVTRISIFIHFRYSKPFKSRFSFLTTRWRQRPKICLSFFSAWSIWYTHQVSSLYDVSVKKQKFPKKRLGTIVIPYNLYDFYETRNSEPMSKANAIVNQKGHQCTSLCINYNVSQDDLKNIRQTPLLLRPYIFGFRRL